MSIPQKSIFHNDETTADKGLMRLTPLEQSSAGFGILVVEDRRLLRKSLGLALRDRGFETWLASDGFEALDLFRQHKSQIDVVLSDVRMPLMNGFRMLNVLRSVYCDVQCWLRTAL